MLSPPFFRGCEEVTQLFISDEFLYASVISMQGKNAFHILHTTQSSLLFSSPMQTVCKVISSNVVPLRTIIIFLRPFYCLRFNKMHVWMLPIIVKRELRLVEMPKSVNFWPNFTVKYFIIFIKQLVFLSYNEQAT